MWFRFKDMYSGGYPKIDESDTILIEASCEDSACWIFEQRFGSDPFEVGCECCGSNYSLSCDESIDNLCRKQDDAIVIPAG